VFKRLIILVLYLFASTLVLAQDEMAGKKVFQIQTIRLWDGCAPDSISDADEGTKPSRTAGTTTPLFHFFFPGGCESGSAPDDGR